MFGASSWLFSCDSAMCQCLDEEDDDAAALAATAFESDDETAAAPPEPRERGAHVKSRRKARAASDERRKHRAASARHGSAREVRSPEVAADDDRRGGPHHRYLTDHGAATDAAKELSVWDEALVSVNRRLSYLGRVTGSERMTRPLKHSFKSSFLGADLKDYKARPPVEPEIPWDKLARRTPVETDAAEADFAAALRGLTEAEFLTPQFDGSRCLLHFASHGDVRACRQIFRHCPNQAVKIQQAKHENKFGLSALAYARHLHRKGQPDLLQLFQRHHVHVKLK